MAIQHSGKDDFFLVLTIAPHFKYTKCSELRAANLLSDSFWKKLGKWLKVLPGFGIQKIHFLA